MSTHIVPSADADVNALYSDRFNRDLVNMRRATEQMGDDRMVYAYRDAATLEVHSLPTMAAARWHSYKLSLGSDGDLTCDCAWCGKRRRQTGERCKHIHGAYRYARRVLGRAAPLLLDGATVIAAIREAR